MTLGYCESCGCALDEWDMCNYGDVCMSCYDAEESPCTGCLDEDCHGCDYEEEEAKPVSNSATGANI